MWFGTDAWEVASRTWSASNKPDSTTKLENEPLTRLSRASERSLVPVSTEAQGKEAIIALSMIA